MRVSAGRIAERFHTLLRPPRRDFLFTYIHGISWKDVEKAPTFAAVFPQLSRFMAGAEFLAAHNAPFDKGVLNACCDAAGAPRPRLPFFCTLKTARGLWKMKPANLPSVCARLGIDLKHHSALSDAEACAKIVLAAMKEEAFTGVA